MADAEHSDPEHFNVAEQRLISLTGSVFTKPSFLATVANAVGGRSSNIRDRQGLEDMGGYPPDRAAGGLWFNRFSSSWDDLRTASDSNEFRPRTFSALAAVGLREEDVPWLSCNGSTVDFTVEVAVFDHPTSSLIPHKQRLVYAPTGGASYARTITQDSNDSKAPACVPVIWHSITALGDEALDEGVGVLGKIASIARVMTAFYGLFGSTRGVFNGHSNDRLVLDLVHHEVVVNAKPGVTILKDLDESIEMQVTKRLSLTSRVTRFVKLTVHQPFKFQV